MAKISISVRFRACQINDKPNYIPMNRAFSRTRFKSVSLAGINRTEPKIFAIDYFVIPDFTPKRNFLPASSSESREAISYVSHNSLPTEWAS